MAALQFEWEGKTLSLDLEGITLQQAIAIKKMCNGLTIFGLLDGLDTLDPDAAKALYWLAHEQSGFRLNVNQLDFPVIAFMVAVKDAGNPADSEPDPTGEPA